MASRLVEEKRMRKQFAKYKKTLSFHDRDERAAKIAYNKVKNKCLAEAYELGEFTETDYEFNNKLVFENNVTMR